MAPSFSRRILSCRNVAVSTSYPPTCQPHSACIGVSVWAQREHHAGVGRRRLRGRGRVRRHEHRARVRARRVRQRGERVLFAGALGSPRRRCSRSSVRRAAGATPRSGDAAWQVGPKRRHIYGQQLPNLEKKLLPYASVVGLPAVFDKVRVQCVPCLRELHLLPVVDASCRDARKRSGGVTWCRSLSPAVAARRSCDRTCVCVMCSCDALRRTRRPWRASSTSPVDPSSSAVAT
jgi:hypothetical protein